MNYTQECQTGRDHAAQVMQEAAQTGNMPRLVKALRAAAKDETGYGAGFLFAIGSEVVK